MDLTLFQLKGNVIIGDDAWEPLRNVEHFDGVIRFQVKPPSFRFNGPPCGSRGDGNHVHLPAAAYCPHIQYYIQYTITPLKKKGKSTAGIIFLKSGLLRAFHRETRPLSANCSRKNCQPLQHPKCPIPPGCQWFSVPPSFGDKKGTSFRTFLFTLDLCSALSP